MSIASGIWQVQQVHSEVLNVIKGIGEELSPNYSEKKQS